MSRCRRPRRPGGLLRRGRRTLRDTAARPEVPLPAIVVASVLDVGLVLGARARAHAVLGPSEHALRLSAYPLPENIDEASERAYVLRTRRRVPALED